MPRLIALLAVTTWSWFGVALAWSQEADPPPAAVAAEEENPIHEELRQLKSELVEAINSGNIDKTLALCSEDVVLTAQNAEVSVGREGIRAYFEKMTKGPDRRVEKFSTDPTVEALAHLYGENTATAYGSSQDHYLLVDGMEFTVDSRWSATMVREADGWKIANVHVSCNLFDNPVLNMTRQWLVWTGVIAGVAGLLVGMLLMWLVRGRGHRPEAPPA